MEERSGTFTCTYSTKEQEEIKRIRDKYKPSTKEANSMEQLRRLDESATQSATVVSLIVGILSTLRWGWMCRTMGWVTSCSFPAPSA